MIAKVSKHLISTKDERLSANASFEEEETNELALESIEEKRRRFVYLWALIPLTRAIDTLVITLSDSNGYIAKMLREVYEENPDFVEWIE